MNIENANLGSGGEGELRKNEGKYQQTYQITPLIRLSPEASPSAASAASFFMTFFNSVGSSLSSCTCSGWMLTAETEKNKVC